MSALMKRRTSRSKPALKVTLGHPNLPRHPRDLPLSLRCVLTAADFSALPENPTWVEVEDLALLIDGYEIASQRPDIRGLMEWVSPIWEGYLERGESLPKDSLELWLILFALQRSYLRDRWDAENDDGSPSALALAILGVYAALRSALQQEQNHPARGNSVYVPPVLIKLPDPALHAAPPLANTINGVLSMRQFWRSSDPADLPEDPAVIVVMDWVNRMAAAGGFETQLDLLGLSHQDVMETILNPAENDDFRPLQQAHPLVLLHCIWRIGVQIERTGYDDMLASVSRCSFTVLSRFWSILRSEIFANRHQPPLVIGGDQMDLEKPAPKPVRR